MNLAARSILGKFKGGEIPLQLISYASQDVQHPCVFCGDAGDSNVN